MKYNVIRLLISSYWVYYAISYESYNRTIFSILLTSIIFTVMYLYKIYEEVQK